MPTRIFVAAFLLLPIRAFAQAPGPPSGWSGKASLSFVAASGNTDTQTLGVSGEVGYHPARWSAHAEASLVRTKTAGTLNADELTSEVRFTRRVTTRIQGYGQLDYLKNRFAGIASRVAVNSGLAWDFLPPKAPRALQFVAGLGYTHETNLVAGNRSFATGNAGLRFSWHLSKTAQITDNGLFTGSLQNAADWRITNMVAISAAINAVFSLRLSHRLDFVNLPVPGFRRADQLTSAAIVASF